MTPAMLLALTIALGFAGGIAMHQARATPNQRLVGIGVLILVALLLALAGKPLGT